MKIKVETKPENLDTLPDTCIVVWLCPELAKKIRAGSMDFQPLIDQLRCEGVNEVNTSCSEKVDIVATPTLYGEDQVLFPGTFAVVVYVNGYPHFRKLGDFPGSELFQACR